MNLIWKLAHRQCKFSIFSATIAIYMYSRGSFLVHGGFIADSMILKLELDIKYFVYIMQWRV